MQIFHDEVMAYMFGPESCQTTPEIKNRRPLTTALLAASIALCGCDFVEIRGMRADLVLPCVREVARNRPDLLELMHGVYTGGADETRAASARVREGSPPCRH